MRLAFVVVSLLIGQQASALQSFSALVGSIALSCNATGGNCVPCCVPNDQCSPLTHVCCEDVGQPSGVGAACCSQQTNGVNCICAPAGGSCATPADCCAGVGTCNASGQCCNYPGQACTANNQCCSNNCDLATSTCLCDSPGGSPNQCFADADCCLVSGAKDCDNGSCVACSSPGGSCTDATDCCYTTTSECNSSMCCASYNGPCTENANCCASDLACVSGECCGSKGAACSAGEPCYSGATCNDGVCSCIAGSDAGCRQNSDCCPGANCELPNGATCNATDENCICVVIP